jgi:membrane-bound lytic murein transglycosylase D
MKYLKALLHTIFVVLLIQENGLMAQSLYDSSKTSGTSLVLLKDNPIVAAFDSLSVAKCFEKSNFTTSNKALNKYNYAADYVPTFNDSIYTLRIAKLNAKSPFGLVYNKDVKDFIDLYAVKKRNLTCRMLGLAEYYFPIFEEYMAKYNIPLELKYLAVVESALNPEAKSWAGANGLWQFIFTTGKMYDLKVTSYVDERFDPVKSTIAACEHFKDLYAIYKDWSLVLAAYNSGPGNVNKAIRRANGEMDFWKIKKFLPRETQGYVPAFIAVTYIMNYPTEHNLYPVAPSFMNFETDTVTVKQKLTFDQISEALNISKEEIEYLNPIFKQGIIPAYQEEKYILRLPSKYIGDFMTNETSIYSYKTKAMIEEEKLLAEKQKQIHIKDSMAALQKNYYKKNTSTVSKNSSSTYIVKAGDGLGIIASRNNCSIAQLQEWNNLKDFNIYPGQKLYVQDPTKAAVTTDSNVTKNEPKKDSVSTGSQAQTVMVNNTQSTNIKYVYHTVQKGDTLWGIANQYKGVTIEEIKRLNNFTDKSMLYVGQKIKVAIAS